jgi:CBS domain-containing protein
VLGSEGRGEQVLKTDQDNALILHDGFDWPEQQTVLQNLTETLLQLGYPLCTGKVMVNNPQWVANQSQWCEKINDWIGHSSADTVMKLAIFSDATAIAGNKSLLNPVMDHLQSSLAGRMLTLSGFVRPALQFSVPLTLFGQVKARKEGLDIKQGGIFAIVHGIRTLALEHGITEKNTFARIEALNALGCLEDDTADNLIESLKLFFKLRLSQQLTQLHTSNNICLEQLDRTERDLLRHGLHVVKKFKQFLAYHYQIRD